MPNSFSLSKQHIFPPVVLGLSCGVGFFIAQESWKRKRWSWSTVSMIIQKLVETDVPWWLLAVGSRGWYPLAFWWVLKDVLSKDIERKERSVDDESESNPGKPDTTLQNASDPVSMAEQERRLPPPPPQIQLQNVPLDAKSITSYQQPQRQLEMLVHNVAHTDLVLSLDPRDGEGQYCLCRPRFSAFDLYTSRILKSLPTSPETVSFPRYERSDEDPRHTIVTPRPSRQKMIPTGFRLEHDTSALKVTPEELQNLRFRGRDVPRIEKYTRTTRLPVLTFV
jgi:hypothetical protein